MTFGGLSMIPSESLNLSSDWIARHIYEDSTLISADFNKVGWSSDTIGSVLYVLDLSNDSVSINSSTPVYF